MELKAALEALNLTRTDLGDKYIVNPLQLAVDKAFRTPKYKRSPEKDYREQALDMVLDNRVPFTSENNTLSKLVVRLQLQIVSPFTGEVVTLGYAGGDSSGATLKGRDSQKNKFSISIDHNAIGVEPSAQPKE